MTPKQVALVQSSWQSVQPVADAAAQIFYSTLFTLDPSLKHMFKGDMAEQGRKLMNMITFAVRGLSRLDVIVPAVQALGRRHAGYGVKDTHYATVGNALLATLKEGLGDDFTDDVRDAWSEAYGLLANTMKDASRAAA